MTSKSIKLSIVSTLYGSEKTIEDFISTHDAMARKLVGKSYEIILVNDGSPDNSHSIVLNLTKTFSKLTLIDLSRNFGHHKALLTGMREANGTSIYICDSDMEEPPEWLEKYWTLKENSAGAFDVFGGVQVKRKRGILDIFTGGLSWKLFSFLSSTELIPNLVTARLMTRAYVDAVISYPEKQVFLATLCSDVGFQHTYIPLEKYRFTPTTYTFRKKLKLLADGVTAFSVKPLYLGVIFSALLAIFGLLMLAITLYLYFKLDTLPGWASQMTIISLIFSALFFVLAIQGLYLGRIFIEVRNRPQTIIKSIAQKGKFL